jgi:hypothetical protein
MTCDIGPVACRQPQADCARREGMARYVIMHRTISILLASAVLALAGPALAGSAANDDDDGQGSGLAAISGRWVEDGASCEGDTAGRLDISAAGDTLTVTTGEASADEVIDSDEDGVVTTHSDEGRFSYALDDEGLVITDLGDRSIEHLTACGDGDDDEVAALPPEAADDVDDDPDPDPDPDSGDKG